MSRGNLLTSSPPYAVDRALRHLGERLRVARLRRNLTIVEVAKRIGTGTRAVRDAESGKSTTAAVVFAALLWQYKMIDQIDTLADRNTDVEGIRLASLREPKRASSSKAQLDNDF